MAAAAGKPAPRAGWRFAAVGAALAAYALLSHALMVHAADRPWAVAVLFGPLVLAVAAAGWQRRRPWMLGACAAGVALLGGVVARGGVDDINRMYVLQYIGIYIALAWAFGSTLRRGGTPFVTTIARAVHTSLKQRFTPAMERYTRWLTGVWTAYFCVMPLLSLAVYLLAPWPWWSFFANLLTPLSAAALMVGEHVQRYRRHPEFDRVSLRAAIEAYQRSGRPAQRSTPP